MEVIAEVVVSLVMFSRRQEMKRDGGSVLVAKLEMREGVQGKEGAVVVGATTTQRGMPCADLLLGSEIWIWSARPPQGAPGCPAGQLVGDWVWPGVPPSSAPQGLLFWSASTSTDQAAT